MILSIRQEINLPFSMPNSISISDGNVYITSGSGNAVYKASMQSLDFLVFVGGKCGLGQNKFREPVYAYSDGPDLYVCDWHNHRVVKYTEGQYSTESGMQGSRYPMIIDLLRLFKNFGNSGSYIVSHFHYKDNCSSIKNSTSYTANFLYFAFSLFWLRRKRFHRMRKPNGLCLINNKLVISQKDGHRLDVMTTNLCAVASHPIPRIGRVGNVSSKCGINLVAVESIGKVYRFTDDFQFNELNLAWGAGNPKPFSAIALTKYLIAVIAVDVLLVFNRMSGEKVCSYRFEGELHGIDSCGKNIYVTDRLNSKLYVVAVTHD